jgi:hypothetical protein
MSDKVFDYENEDNTEDKDFTWADAHSIGNRMTRLTPMGVTKPSMNMGHGASCPDCSKGILQDTSTELGRDSHFKESMKIHNQNLGGND